MYSARVLIGSWDYLCTLRLVREIPFFIGFSTLKDRSTLLTQTQQFLFIYLDTLMNLKTAFANVADAISEQKWYKC